MAAPRVSVVIPVFNRRDLMQRTLDALDAQTYDDFEVIVVDDGSTDGVGDLAEATLVHGRPVRVVRQPNRGAVQARITGVAAARGDVLAFTDSDCVPGEHWLAAGVARIDDGADVVHGWIRPERRVQPLERSVDQTDDGLYATANVFYRRDAFEAAGGFDVDAARRWGFRATSRAKGLGFGEDTLLGWHVARVGVSVYEPDCVVTHHVFPADFREWLSRGWSMAAFPALLREVPELKATFLRRGVLFHDDRRVPVYATAAALLTRRRVFVAAGALWWAWRRYRDTGETGYDRSRRVVIAAQLMAVDAVTATAMTLGSIRNRTVAL
jgi:glycosyltransferase involved in cell wall biosynthesis